MKKERFPHKTKLDQPDFAFHIGNNYWKGYFVGDNFEEGINGATDNEGKRIFINGYQKYNPAVIGHEIAHAFLYEGWGVQVESVTGDNFDDLVKNVNKLNESLAKQIGEFVAKVVEKTVYVMGDKSGKVDV